MTWSLNETEILARKAAYGAGYSFGLAEDAGRATRWLCARDLRGLQAFADLLKKKDNGLSKSKCPIIQGTSLCDGLMGISCPPKSIGPVVCPIFLLPFAAWAARQFNWRVELEISSIQIQVMANGQISCLFHPELLKYSTVTLREQFEPGTTPVLIGQRAKTDRVSVTTLLQFAGRTYAPSTEESRNQGAGAGMSDND